MTSLTWLDYSEQERRQAMDVIDLFREEDTRDELGLGGEEVGVIGYRAGLHVQRLPSSVYWYGLHRWGILRFEGTEEDYQRRLDVYYRRLDERVLGDAAEALEARPANWDPHLPLPPDEFPSLVTFQLTRKEAEYLIDRVANGAHESLLAHLMLTRRTIDDESFAWDLPPSSLNERLTDQIRHAQNFSEVLHGAALLYNLILAEQKPDAAMVEHYRERLERWWDIIRAREADLAAWDRNAFWKLVTRQGARVPQPTRDFVNTWLALTLTARTLESIIASRRLVMERERWLKRGRARIGNPRALESWRGASGSAQIDYRWTRPVRAIVNDILQPLVEEDKSRA